VRFKIKWV
jgi:hypothetical protein